MGLRISNGSPKQITVGGYTFDWDPASNSNDILLWGQASDGTSNPYRTLRQLNATAGFIVPAGRTLKIIAIDLLTTAAYAAQWGIGYGDTDVGLTSAALPASNVPHNNRYAVAGVAASAGSFGSRGGLAFSVPEGKYPFANSAGSASDRSAVQVYCKLV